MKLVFEAPECLWLDNTVKKLAVLMRRDPVVLRTCKKMEYKFAGTPRHVFLGAKERRLLLEIAKYRAETLQTSPTDEVAVVDKIIEVLSAVA